MREWIEAGLTSVVDHEYNVLLSYPPKPPSFNKGKLVFVSSVYQMDMMQRTMNFSFEEKLILINSSYSPGKSVIKRAERVGAAGIIVFSDADGVPGDAIHRGSLAMQPGDILTQGYPALDYAVRLNISEAELPSLPILTVDKMTDRIVLVGSHRDAWVNGAVDPGGSTAILMELVTTFTKMRQQGWEPLRTLMFCSWDAEEFGMFGSIEFAEHHREILNRMAVAYVNIDSPVMGTEDLKIVGSPLLTDLIRKAASEVRHPTKAVSVLQNIEGLNRNRTKWKFRLGRPSANTDHAQFLFNLGIPSSFMMWKSKTSILYPVYHTSYDTFEYLQEHIDPNFKFHGAIAELHARMLFSLTSDVIIPFNVTSYAAELNIEIGEMALFIPALNNTEIQNILEIFSIKIKEHQTAAAEFDDLLSSVNLADSFEVQNINDRLIGLERAFIDPLFENGSVLVRVLRIYLLKSEWPYIKQLNHNIVIECGIDIEEFFCTQIYHKLKAKKATTPNSLVSYPTDKNLYVPGMNTQNTDLKKQSLDLIRAMRGTCIRRMKESPEPGLSWSPIWRLEEHPRLQGNLLLFCRLASSS
ncbi:hypothetical protein CAPTEDRAFT_223400 [Capitella teleta]|uniref:Peptidase M28 domain-containing protein n=1 Tax=Capitella teleta TaxID=283909 RepID=R7UMH0_CAPTE|nr:hypothetical protein CAPTEDRAFT_223400 [Capitella teleta]|eukprot:ELU07734.1 hypothetical protein CAPTEDRAFT_223400 [Capitella teleta]